MKHRLLTIAAMLLPACQIVGPARADVTEFTDKDEWIAAAGPFTTIDFTGFPPATFITEQYADLGIHFTDGDDVIHFTETYKNDGVGLFGNGDIALLFDSPQAWIAADFPGDIQIDLFAGDRLLHSIQFIELCTGWTRTASTN